MSKTPEISLLEFDPNKEAIVNPGSLTRKSVQLPDKCILSFCHDVIHRLCSAGTVKKISEINSESGKKPVFLYKTAKTEFTLLHLPVGAPMAAILLEELIHAGCKSFMVSGSSGVLDSDIAAGSLIVPTSAVRDEGTSFHYAPPSREISFPPEITETVINKLKELNYPFHIGKVWSTDAFYRETRAKFTQRQKEGCIAAEMEASALTAVAQFRGVKLGYLLYAADSIAGQEWDSRNGWSLHELRDKLLEISAEICAEL